jgi:hypothetical protein
MPPTNVQRAIIHKEQCGVGKPNKERRAEDLPKRGDLRSISVATHQHPEATECYTKNRFLSHL